ncbi:MAG TPA: alpha-glucan family phosphorylase [Planctomycetota bacterium]|nr:alpha-glucan family phosphorylase [Planctomycetota bacterium]
MNSSLFEVSWEVVNKVGGIHTVVSTKARTLVERYGDHYIAIGPWLLANERQEEAFEPEAGFEGFAESCRALGVPVRVGRWKIPGRPRTILVEFSGLFAQKDPILAGLWDRHQVDSITGGWDYVEPVLFGWAAGMVIELWWQEFIAPAHGRAVAQFHEWMTGSGLLLLESRVPSIGTVFTTHATMLGRALSATGHSPEEGLGTKTPEEFAETLGVRSKHSLEGVCARTADVFTTVSSITATEAALVHRREAEPLLPNGIDLGVIDEMCEGIEFAQARSALVDLTRRFFAEDLEQACYLILSGRYEFHNKGIDVLLEALARLAARPGRPIVALLMVPAGHSGLRQQLQQRMRAPLESIQGGLGLSTHNLFDPEHDPIQVACAALGLDNRPGSRIKVLQIPIYLHARDGLLNMPYEAVLRATDLSAFPSFYEPWGYTPEESLAVGVPTITSDHAGFGRWARDQGLGVQDGLVVLRRVGTSREQTAADLAGVIDEFVATDRDRAQTVAICRRTAQRTAWSDLIAHYETSFQRALDASLTRSRIAPMQSFRPRVAMPVAPVPEGRRPHLSTFDVAATLPDSLAGLERLSRNYWWSWDPEGMTLFAELSPLAWSSTGHNPVSTLALVFPEDLDEKAADPSFAQKLRRVLSRFDEYMRAAGRELDLGGGLSISPRHPIAYFCAEFGVHESLRIYSGGLGILSGDHLKSASDLNLPLVAIGLFYRSGYMQQRLSSSGEQIALDVDNDPRRLAMELVRDEQGGPLEITLNLPSSALVLRAWSVAVGRVTLYLLDSNVDKNRPEDREITARLYGGDQEARIRQEIVLGRGGARLLERLKIEPCVYHINEGHAAFLSLERIGRLVREGGLTFEQAREIVSATTAFTTHTPVPAGHDRFGEDLMRRYFSDAANWVGLPWDRFIALGQSDEDRGTFNMTYLALAFCHFANGVSKLHGEVSKELLSPFWPKLLRGELPIASVTNGVHLPSWTHPEIAALLAPKGPTVRGVDFAERASAIPLEALFEVKKSLKRRLFKRVRANLERSFTERHDRPVMLSRMIAGLDERALVIGFARRFAPYKRAQLLFQDPARLAALLSNKERPVRILIAGKAHPRDGFGKDILKSVAMLTRSEEFLGKVMFVDDYDIAVARYLVQGVDVWLNTPVRPLEASGTSGMKVAANGGLNLSVLDGWWCEGFDGHNGWTIGEGRTYESQELQDELDSSMLYSLLEEQIVPLFFQRDASGLPRGWLERVRHCLTTIPPVFDTDRMVGEYRQQAYEPLARGYFALTADGAALAKKRASDAARMERDFATISISALRVSELSNLKVGDAIEARVEVDLGALSPDDVLVELVLGHSKSGKDLHNMLLVRLMPLSQSRSRKKAPWIFEGSQRMQRSGTFGYGIRVRARVGASAGARGQDLVLWA